MQKHSIFIKIKQFFVKFYTTNKKLFFIFIGLCVVVIGGFCSIVVKENRAVTNNTKTQIETQSSDYASSIENKIKKVLNSLDAIKKVDVFVMVDSSQKNEYLTETETVKNLMGGTETETKKETIVFEKDGSKSSPVVVSKVNPKITGVLICINKIDASTKVSILNSLATVLNIDSSCISILQDR